VRVLICTNMWPSPARPAFGSFVKEQVEDLERAGVEIDVLYVRGTESRANYARAMVQLRQRLRSRPYDLVHAHYGLTGAVALTQRKLPVVTTFHGSETGYVPWQTRVSWFVARMSEPIFVSSDAAVRMKLPTAHVIPVGVDVELFRPLDRPAVRQELGWEPEARHVLLPGARGNRRKGATLFDAVFEEVRESAPDVRAVSLDNLSREGAARVVAAADVVLMTSEFEGAPAAIKESLACSTPVVSVPVGDVPDTISGLPGCAVCERDVGSLAAAVLHALSAPGAPALRARAEEFARPLIAERVCSVYEKVLGRNQPAARSGKALRLGRNGRVASVVDHVGEDSLEVQARLPADGAP
jgi:glycosyltransferase involved in cell wall biosynthesis